MSEQQAKQTHKAIGGGLRWCPAKDLTFTAAMVKDGKCPYCGQEVR